MGNLASEMVELGDGRAVLVMAHNADKISDDEWESSYLLHLRKRKDDQTLMQTTNIVFAEGGGPSTKQRASGNAIFKGGDKYEFRVAVITESMLVRGAVTAIGWLNPLISAYAPRNWAHAFTHAGVKDRDRGAIVEAMTRIDRLVKVVPLRAVLAAMQTPNAADHS